MIPKEKAKELVGKYKEFTEDNYAENYYNAKQCALIAVDELINHCHVVNIVYWQEVKQEIELL